MNSRQFFFILVTISIGAVLCPNSILAQTISSPYRFIETKQEAGLFAGTFSPGTGRFDLGPAPGTVFGARYGVNLSGPFGLEGVVTYYSSNRSIIDPGRVEGDMNVGEMPSDLLQLDGRLRFSLTGDRTWHGLSPFLFTGGGVVFGIGSDDSDDVALLPDDIFDFGTSFVGIVGTGLRWIPRERFMVRTDFAFSLWKLKTPQGFLNPERGFTGVAESEWASGPSITLGLTYWF